MMANYTFVMAFKFIEVTKFGYEMMLTYGKPFYYLLCKIDILYIISDI